MAELSRNHAWLTLLGGAGAALAVLLSRRRTRGYAQIHPQLRSLPMRFRSPEFSAATLRVTRLDAPTECVQGVGLKAHPVESADGTIVTAFVYRPANAIQGGPVILHTHGGGMILGSAASFHAAVSTIARDLGIVVVATDYRLAPEHPFPAPLDDVHAVYRWLVAGAGALGVDAARIIAIGDSAGGGLTAALCQRVHDEGGIAPVFQLLVYPMLDDRTTLRRATGIRGQLIWTERSNLFGWSSYLGRRPVAGHAPDYAAPARRRDLSGLPPAWIGVGTLDLFYDEDIDYAARLRACGVPCAVDIIDGAFHAFDLIDSDIGRAFRARILDVVRAVLAGRDPSDPQQFGGVGQIVQPGGERA